MLDEPSIGLHPRDTGRLIDVLKALRDQGNTVLVVEHDRAIIKVADDIIDLGPGAGEQETGMGHRCDQGRKLSSGASGSRHWRKGRFRIPGVGGDRGGGGIGVLL